MQSLLLTLIICCPIQNLHRYEYEAVRMAIPVRVVLYAQNEQIAKKAAEAVFQRFLEIDNSMSDYNDESEIMKLTANTDAQIWQPVSDDLFNVLKAARHYCEITEGAFDITVGPLSRLWRRARRLKVAPTPEQTEKAMALIGNSVWELDENAKRLRVLKKGVRFDFGGIAKGYALDESMKKFKEHGILSALIDAGGDIIVSDPPPNGKWTISVLHEESIELDNAAIANSGDTYQFVEIDGVRYSHIIDPRTGKPVTDKKPISVIAKTAIEADALASAVSAL